MQINHELALQSYVIEEDCGTLKISLWSGYSMEGIKPEYRVKMPIPYKQAKELKALIKYLLNQEKNKILKERQAH